MTHVQSLRWQTYRQLARRARRRYRLGLVFLATVGVALMAISFMDRRGVWLGHAVRPQDIWKYHMRLTTVSAVLDANTIALPDGTRVCLLGTNPPSAAHWQALARNRLQSLVAGREVLLRLEPQALRDAQGRVLAQVCLEDRDLAIDLLKEGLLRVDRRVESPFRGTLVSAEDSARRKRLGLWLEPGTAERAGPEASPRK